jgi:hypothetical protein
MVVVPCSVVLHQYANSSYARPSPFRYFKTSPEIIRLAVMLDIRFVNGRVKVSQRAAQNVATLGLARLPRERAPASGRPRFSQSWRLPGCFGP